MLQTDLLKGKFLAVVLDGICGVEMVVDVNIAANQ